MYEQSIKLLEKKGIKFEKGLTFVELEQIEKIYQIKFPNTLKEFLMIGLPISKGFYNWRDTAEENISFIKQVMKKPISDIDDMADEVYWCDDWGDEPENEEDIVKKVKERLTNAPQLLPIYAHRYIPVISDENPPIISIHDIDIIYYGKNLEDYFKVEFGEKKQNAIEFQKIKPIPFWSDIM